MFASRLDESYAVEVRSALTPLTVAKIGANSAVRFAPPFIATIASGLDVSLATVGAAIGVGELVGLLAPTLTRLAGRLTRRSAICVGLTGIAAGATTCATSQHIVQFALGLALMAMSKIVFDLGIIAWISERVPYARIGRVIGLTETAWAASLFTGVALMGLLTGLTSWRWAYVLAAVAIVVFAAVLRSRLPAEPRPAHDGHQTRRSRPGLGIGWWVIAATFTLTASAQAIFVTFGKWLEQEYDFSATNLAVVILGLGAVELFGTSLTVRYADIWGKQRSTMWGAALMVPCAIALAAFNHSLAIGLAMLGAFIATFEFSIVSTVSLASSLVPSNPSAGLGFMAGAGTLGRAVMAAPATAAFTEFGLRVPAILAAACAAVTVALHLQYRRARATAAPTAAAQPSR